ncbi:MAG: MATE family efflux transporter [Eubacteriales bacterium]|nr:MATE family efflux transporter [Eubacteriales bacterium]
MNKSSDIDLTVGNPGKVILRFCIPILLTSLLQNLYSTIDTIVIGQFVGKEALAGVGSTGAVNFLVIGFCMGLCMGFVIPIAQFYGAKDYLSLRKTYANSIWVSLAFGLTITVIVCIFCRQILLIMMTPVEVMAPAYDYIFLIFAGIPITIAYNLLAGTIRSLGDSKSPLIFLIYAAIINIGFDILSVTVFHMGVRGPAAATLLAQLFSCILCYFHIKKNFRILHIEDVSEWKLDSHFIGKLCKMGVPMGFQFSITAIGCVILQIGVNTLGSSAIAAVAAGSKFGMFLQCPTDALGSTMSTYAGQNVGAKKIDRIGQGLRFAVISGCIYSIVIFVIMFFTAKYCMLLFIKPNETQIIADAALYCIISALFYPFLVLVNTVRYTIQGMGYSTFAVIAGVLEMFARSFVGVSLIPIFGYVASCFSSPFAWIFADLFLVPAFFHVKKKNNETTHGSIIVTLEKTMFPMMIRNHILLKHKKGAVASKAAFECP